MGVAEGDAAIWLAYAALTMAHGCVWLGTAEVIVLLKATPFAIPRRPMAMANKLYFIPCDGGAVQELLAVQHEGGERRSSQRTIPFPSKVPHTRPTATLMYCV